MKYYVVFDKTIDQCDKSSSPVLFKNEYLVIYEGDKKAKSLSELELGDNEIIELLKALSSFFHFIDDQQDQSQFIPEILWPRECEIEDEITLFGGSFNPWHDGHSECVRQAQEMKKNVVIIPDHSPWKDNVIRNPLCLIETIYKNTNGKVIIYPEFSLRGERNPTSKWISRVQLQKISWLMGADTFNNFLKWFDVETVIEKLNEIIVVPRREKLCHLTLLELEGRVRVVSLGNHQFENLSSTQMRNTKEEI